MVDVCDGERWGGGERKEKGQAHADIFFLLPHIIPAFQGVMRSAYTEDERLIRAEKGEMYTMERQSCATA